MIRSRKLAAHGFNDAGARPALPVLAAICLCGISCTVADSAAERMQSGRTSPKTAEGKAAMSQSAVKHGLIAVQDVLTTENQAKFDQF